MRCRPGPRSLVSEGSALDGVLDHSGWLWGLSLIVLTMAIHATAIVMLAFVGLRIRVRLETRGLKVWKLIATLICVIGVIGCYWPCCTE